MPRKQENSRPKFKPPTHYEEFCETFDASHLCFCPRKLVTLCCAPTTPRPSQSFLYTQLLMEATTLHSSGRVSLHPLLGTVTPKLTISTYRGRNTNPDAPITMPRNANTPAGTTRGSRGRLAMVWMLEPARDGECNVKNSWSSDVLGMIVGLGGGVWQSFSYYKPKIGRAHV